MTRIYIKTQLSLFFKSDFVEKFEDASLSIKKEFGENVITQIIGLPDSAPSEIPRLMANFGKASFNLSKNRLDFFSEDNEKFFEENSDKIFNLMSNLHVEIGRVGFVHTSFKELSIENFKKIFNSSIFNPESFKEIAVRINEDAKVGGFEANNLHMYTTGGYVNSDKIEERGVIITRDINTFPADLSKNLFTKDALNKFISESVSLSGKILI